MNIVVLIGRLTKDPEVITTSNGNKRTSITLAIPRIYRNSEGEYQTDFVRCILWNSIAVNTSEHCSKGDLIGVRGRIEVSNYTKDDEVKYETNVIAERVSFLMNKKLRDEFMRMEAAEEEFEEIVQE